MTNLFQHMYEHVNIAVKQIFYLFFFFSKCGHMLEIRVAQRSSIGRPKVKPSLADL